MALRGTYVKPEFCCTLRVSGRSSFTDKLALEMAEDGRSKTLVFVLYISVHSIIMINKSQ